MNIIHNIPLHRESLQYIEEIFRKYNEVKYSTNKIIRDPIIHMYPTHDTRDEDGSLNGYSDSMFTTIKIYEPHSGEFMQLHNRDALDMYNSKVKIFQVKCFKDGSTMVQMHGTYQFSNGQSVDVYMVD